MDENHAVQLQDWGSHMFPAPCGIVILNVYSQVWLFRYIGKGSDGGPFVFTRHDVNGR